MRTRRSQSSSDPVSPEVRGGHRTVLLHEAVEQLALQRSDIVLDATLGGAGHARAMAEALSSDGMLIGIDLDEAAIARARDALHGVAPKVELIQANFRHMRKELEARGVSRISKALFDLGWSGYQLDAGRGFSFLKDEPLEMTYAAYGAPLTASTIVNTWDESSIADVLWGWGEERYARRIARRIVEERSKQPFTSSLQLAEAIKTAVPPAYRYGKIHPATRTFQALRIAVNDELGAAQEGIQAAWDLLVPGGRIAVITFHSIEDRLVKRLFVQWEDEGAGERVPTKPIVPSEVEIRSNPRARSAKLRVIEKCSR